MKVLAYILALSLLSISVIAETQTSSFNLSINTTYDNNSVTIVSEGFSVTYLLTNQSNSSSHLVNFTRTYNITTVNISSCNQETLNDIKSKVDKLSNSGDYFENYVSCFGNLSSAQTRLTDCQGKPTYKKENDDCQSALLLTTSQRDAKDLVIENVENETGRWKSFYEEEQSKVTGLIEESNKLANQRFFPYGLGGLALGFGIAYYIFVKSKKVSELKDDMPQM